FGEPQKPPIQAAQVRQAVLDLGAQAFALRLEERGTLAVEFLRRAKRRPGVLAVADSTGLRLSYGRLAAAGYVLAEKLEPLLGPDPNVGVLLPPSVGAALSNLALVLGGRVPVNLNYTAGA